jgi:hypothetical protein
MTSPSKHRSDAFLFKKRFDEAMAKADLDAKHTVGYSYGWADPRKVVAAIERDMARERRAERWSKVTPGWFWFLSGALLGAAVTRMLT